MELKSNVPSEFFPISKFVRSLFANVPSCVISWKSFSFSRLFRKSRYSTDSRCLFSDQFIRKIRSTTLISESSNYPQPLNRSLTIATAARTACFAPNRAIAVPRGPHNRKSSGAGRTWPRGSGVRSARGEKKEQYGTRQGCAQLVSWRGDQRGRRGVTTWRNLTFARILAIGVLRGGHSSTGQSHLFAPSVCFDHSVCTLSESCSPIVPRSLFLQQLRFSPYLTSLHLCSEFLRGNRPARCWSRAPFLAPDRWLPGEPGNVYFTTVTYRPWPSTTENTPEERSCLRAVPSYQRHWPVTGSVATSCSRRARG